MYARRRTMGFQVLTFLPSIHPSPRFAILPGDPFSLKNKKHGVQSVLCKIKTNAVPFLIP